MIGFLEGDVRAVRAGYVIVMAGGVGYKVSALSNTLVGLTSGQTVALWTHLSIRDDAHDLYGFSTEEELGFFELLLSVSGIGPRSALAILESATVEVLRTAISQGKSEYLTKVGGIGRKTAEKIVLELRDKVGVAAEGTPEAMRGDEEALEAMRALGYAQHEAREALRKVPSEITGGSERLREALKILGS